MKQLLLAIALIALPVALFSGYETFRGGSAEAAPAGLGDLSAFTTIITDVAALVDKGDMPAAGKRITDFETAWDQAETAIRPLNPTQWGHVDDAADGALHAVRAGTPDIPAAKAALASLLKVLGNPDITG